MNQQIIEAPRAGAAELITSKTALVALEKAALAELSVVDAGIAALRRKYRNKTYDVATAEGMDAARKARMDIRDRRFKVPHIVKDQKAAIKKVAEKVDSEGERIVAALERGDTEQAKTLMLEHIGMVERSLDIRPPEPPPGASERLRATLAPVGTELLADSLMDTVQKTAV